MKTTGAATKSLFTLITLVAVLTLAAAPLALGGQGVEGTRLVWNIEAPGESPMEMGISLAPDQMRMDMGQQMSMIHRGGDMIMIMHAQQAYMVMSEEMMQQMGAMMGARGQQQVEEEPDLSTPPSFVRTGNTKQIGPWSAYEVEVTHPEQPGQTTVWFSEDVDVDLVTFLRQLSQSMESFTSPMMQGMRRGASGAELGMLGALHEQIGQMDLPTGFPVQVINVEGGETTTITLNEAEQGTLSPGTFEAPSGYQQMQLPGIRR